MNGSLGALANWLTLFFALPIGQAMWSDIRFRRISNRVCAVVLSMGVAIRALGGFTPVAASLGIALGLFAVLLLLWAMRLIGGGDIKLAAACAAGIPPAACFDFLFWTIVSGGILAVLYFLLARLPCSPGDGQRNSNARRLLAIEARRARQHHSMPYSLAIAAGFAFALLTTANGS